MFAMPVTFIISKRYINITQNVTPLLPVRWAKTSDCNVVTLFLDGIIFGTRFVYKANKTHFQKYYVCFEPRNVTSHILGPLRWGNTCNAATLHGVTTFDGKPCLSGGLQIFEALQLALRELLQTLQSFGGGMNE